MRMRDQIWWNLITQTKPFKTVVLKKERSFDAMPYFSIQFCLISQDREVPKQCNKRSTTPGSSRPRYWTSCTTHRNRNSADVRLLNGHKRKIACSVLSFWYNANFKRNWICCFQDLFGLNENISNKEYNTKLFRSQPYNFTPKPNMQKFTM